METTLIVIASLLMIAVYNGYINLWGLESSHKLKKKYSEQWHAIGLIIRLMLVAVVIINAGWFWGWIAGIAGGHMFDIIINYIRGHKWNYTGTVALSDKYSTYTWAGKVLYIIAGSVFLYPYISYSTIVGIWLGVFVLLFIAGAILYWLKKPTLNKTVLKISTVVILLLTGLLLIALLKEGVLFTGAAKTYF